MSTVSKHPQSAQRAHARCSRLVWSRLTCASKGRIDLPQTAQALERGDGGRSKEARRARRSVRESRASSGGRCGACGFFCFSLAVGGWGMSSAGGAAGVEEDDDDGPTALVRVLLLLVLLVAWVVEERAGPAGLGAVLIARLENGEEEEEALASEEADG